MSVLKIKYEWLAKLLPEGFPYPSSTLISGPGGTGKPLVEFAFVAAWLEAGGSVIGIPLQYPTAEFVGTSMNKLYNINLDNYRGKISFIQFDPTSDRWEKMGNDALKANLLKPEVWDEAIGEAEKMVERGGLGTMVFGSALNLLLFSPTYKNSILGELKEIIKRERSKTYIFSVSTSAFADEIKIWEEAADNLMFTRIEKPMRLFFRVSKVKGAGFSKEEMEVPVSKETLKEIREVAETTRRRTIPQIMNI